MFWTCLAAPERAQMFLRSLTQTPLQRCADAVSSPVPVPVAYDANGELRWGVATTVSHLSSSNSCSAVNGDSVVPAERPCTYCMLP